MESWFSPVGPLDPLPHWKTELLRIQKIFGFLQQFRPVTPLSDCSVSVDYFDMLLRYRQARRSLERHGLRLIDPGRAQVKIPSRRDGRPVWLCWAADEGRPCTWHERDESWEARRPLDREGPWDRAP